jgi:hypothetical protein
LAVSRTFVGGAGTSEASSLTVKVCPPIVSVPVRGLVDVFGSTVKLTVPFPDPFPPDVIVTQLAPLVAVHAQPVPAVTFALAVPPVAVMFLDVAESV